MNVSSRGSTKPKAGLQILWSDGERVYCRAQHRGADGKPKHVLIVRLTGDPTLASLDRIAHEYALRDELDGGWAVRPLDLVRERGRTSLILEDPDSEPIAHLLGAPMKLDRFLRLAIAIAGALIKLHQRGLIHRDLKPATILVDRAGEVRLTGFGIASRLSSERRQYEPLETIAGTLAYMAPEQTGRIDRPVDSRSDLYAVGVTFYQMLTGSLPFAAADPAEWVHCHVARPPMAPALRLKGVPGAASAVIMRLLAKTPEERYQTAFGLKADLQRCLTAWDTRGQIEDFVLGQTDVPNRLVIPTKLYGREREVESLLSAFDRTGQNATPELILVSGYSGIGKSALVNELQKALIPKCGIFASGKFDQHKRDMPYATLAQAFQGLVRSLLAKSDVDLVPWREELHKALDPLGQLIVDLVPELELVIGDQPPVPDASPQDEQRRFQLVFRRFMGVFAKPNHPLALFLDDLQWLDVATLDLIETLLTGSDLRHLMLIGAYRHNEVDAEHPLTRRLMAFRDSGAPIHEISLGPLTRMGVEQLALDSIRCELAQVAPLAQLLHEKTGGNPFFLVQFLHALCAEELLAFDHDTARWSWDLGRIHAKGYTENVADLMIGRLSGLRAEARQVLLELACLGNSADASTLALVHKTTEPEVHAILQEAARLELIQLLGNSYAFVHDRVQEAAYVLQPDEGTRAALHLRIGRALAARLAHDETSERLYAVANQLNRGLSASISETEQEQIISINLAAGRRARNTAAYAAAIAYLDIARELLGDDADPRCSRTAFAVALLHAECHFLVGHLSVAEAELLVLSQSCPDLQSSVDVTRLQALLYTAAEQLGRAVDVCVAFLRQLGIGWSSHPNSRQVDEERRRLRILANGLSGEQLDALPAMTDPNHRAAMAVLADLIIPANHVDRDLSDISLLLASRLTLEHGIAPGSCFALTSAFGVLASNPLDAELGFRLSQFGATLADQEPQTGLSGRALLAFGIHTTPWVRPVRFGLPFAQRGVAFCSAVGDLSFVAYGHRGLLSVGLFCGDPLSEICADAEHAIAFAQASGLLLSVENLASQKFLALVLMGRDQERCFERPTIIASHPSEDTQPLTAFLSYIAKIQLSVLAGRHDDALALAKLADRLSWRFRGYLEFTEYRFYTGLAHATACHGSLVQDFEEHVAGLREQHRKFTIWSARSPTNFAARQALLAAELAYIEGRLLEAESLYERSIELAREAGFVQIEAIAAECAARFHDARGLHTVVLCYMTRARDCYSRWGASAKIRQLEPANPNLPALEPLSGPLAASEFPIHQLDIDALFRASRALSREMKLSALIQTLMRLVIEHAAAERAILFLIPDDRPHAVAEARLVAGDVDVIVSEAGHLNTEFSQAAFNYVIRTRTSLNSAQPANKDLLWADSYLEQRRNISIHCLPILTHAKLVGLLYLESPAAVGAFTPQRTAVLDLLAAQAAISLENTRLYAELQHSEALLAEGQSISHTGSWSWDAHTGELFWSDEHYRIFGMDPASGKAPSLLQVLRMVHPEDRAALRRSVRSSIRNRDALSCEYRLICSNEVRQLQIVGRPSIDSFGTLISYIGTTIDLSDYRRAQEALQVAQTDLAHAARLTAIGELTGLIGHEVRQPLAAIAASAGACLSWLMHAPPDTGKAAAAAARVAEYAQSASSIIDSIHQMARKSPSTRKALDINESIRETVTLLGGELRRQGVTLKVNLAASRQPIFGDRIQLQQVIMNLMMNGIEAMTTVTDRPRLLLLNVETESSGHVVVAVSDTGVGLPAGKIDRVFEAFFTTKPNGLGVGLAICRSIIAAHGGTLWASPNQPNGSVFRFRLPTATSRPY
jgi:predicted ATPase/signal transduction histidine kinase